MTAPATVPAAKTAATEPPKAQTAAPDRQKTVPGPAADPDAAPATAPAAKTAATEPPKAQTAAPDCQKTSAEPQQPAPADFSIDDMPKASPEVSKKKIQDEVKLFRSALAQKRMAEDQENGRYPQHGALLTEGKRGGNKGKTGKATPSGEGSFSVSGGGLTDTPPNSHGEPPPPKTKGARPVSSYEVKWASTPTHEELLERMRALEKHIGILLSSSDVTRRLSEIEARVDEIYRQVQRLGGSTNTHTDTHGNRFRAGHERRRDHTTCDLSMPLPEPPLMSGSCATPLTSRLLLPQGVPPGCERVTKAQESGHAVYSAAAVDSGAFRPPKGVPPGCENVTETITSRPHQRTRAPLTRANATVLVVPGNSDDRVVIEDSCPNQKRRRRRSRRRSAGNSQRRRPLGQTCEHANSPKNPAATEDPVNPRPNQQGRIPPACEDVSNPPESPDAAPANPQSHRRDAANTRMRRQLRDHADDQLERSNSEDPAAVRKHVTVLLTPNNSLPPTPPQGSKVMRDVEHPALTPLTSAQRPQEIQQKSRRCFRCGDLIPCGKFCKCPRHVKCDHCGGAHLSGLHDQARSSYLQKCAAHNWEPHNYYDRSPALNRNWWFVQTFPRNRTERKRLKRCLARKTREAPDTPHEVDFAENSASPARRRSAKGIQPILGPHWWQWMMGLDTKAYCP